MLICLMVVAVGGRVDIVSRGEEHAVIEINTVPGFTEKAYFLLLQNMMEYHIKI